MEAIVVERTIWIKASQERAWRAVTDANQLEQWFAVGCPWEIPALQVGATVKFHNTETDILSAVIDVLDPPRQFVLRWPPTSENPATLVTAFVLEAENSGTRITIIESGYETMSIESRQQWMTMAGEGYGMSLDNLKAYLEGENQ